MRHRLRTVLGVGGEVAVTLAVLLLLYLVWLFGWTTVVARAEADATVEDFLAGLTPATSTAVPLRTDEPPAVEPVAEGETLGVLRVPRWDGLTSNAMPIVEGTTAAVLDRAAAGHYVGTQLFGEVGNVGLAGHRRTYGNSFRYVDRLQVGDQLIIETATTWYVYEVVSSEVVDPSDSDVVAPVPHHREQRATERLLTLTTCHSLTAGEYGNDHRWVTYAVLVGWLDRADGTPEQLVDD
ncbi:MAG TPA: class E sortase [Cellulomonas sp.]